jgi:hypothetical protein
MIKLRAMRWTGYAACMEEKRNTHRILVVKPEGKTPLGRPRCRWRNNIKMDLLEKQDEVAWTGLIRFRTGTSGGLS